MNLTLPARPWLSSRASSARDHNIQFRRLLLVLTVAALLLAAAAPGYSHGWGSRHPNQSPGPPCGCSDPCDGGGGDDPCGRPIFSVNPFTGDLIITDKPLSYQGAGGTLPFRMHYSAQSPEASPLGDHWGHTFSTRLFPDMPYGVSLLKANQNAYFFPYDALHGTFPVSSRGACQVSQTTDGQGNPDGYQVSRLFDNVRQKAPSVETLPPATQSSANPQPPGKAKFDLSGQLQKITNSDGLEWTVLYLSGRVNTVTDPKGRQTTFTYSGNGRLTRVDIPGGQHADFTYDANGRLSTVTDAIGDTYTYGYTGTETKVTSLTEPDGRQFLFTYTTFRNSPAVSSISIAGLSSSLVTYEYLPQADGRLIVDVTEIKEGQDRVTRYLYENTDDEANGRYFGTLLQLVQDQGDATHLNATQAWVYNSNYKVVKYRDSYQTETGGKEHRHWFYYEDANLPLFLTKLIDGENADANPPTSNCPAYRLYYDSANPNSGSFGNLTKITTPQNRELDITYYSGTHRPHEITLVDKDFNNQQYNHTTHFDWYDANTGYLLHTLTDAEGNATNFSYDSSKWYLTTIDPPFGSNVTVGTNDVGDITSVTDGNGNQTTFQWDAIHRLTQITYPSVGAGAKSVLLDWMCCGLNQVTDENGIVTKAEYDPYTHWLEKLTEDFGTGHLNYVTEYTYDEVGNTKTVKNARGNTTSYTYDNLDRVVRADYPDSTYETWQYRDDGRVWKHTDARGRLVTYRYDADDRLSGPYASGYKAIDYPNNTDLYLTRDYDGLVTEFRDASGTNTADYYLGGWLKTLANATTGKTVTYQYNDVGAISTLTTPGNLDFTYTYNPLNLLSTVANPNGVSVSFSYDDAARLTQMTRPGGRIEYSANARNWLTSIKNLAGDGSTRYRADYFYSDGSLWDHTGNPLKRTEYWAGTGGYNTTLRYDNVYRQTQETLKDPSNATIYDLAYGYDAVGNRTSRTLGGSTITYVYDNNSKLGSVGVTPPNYTDLATFGYDNNGNMTSASGSMLGAWTLVYDDMNRPTSIAYPSGGGSVTDLFYYTASGLRYRARLDGTYRRYIYSGDRVLEETNDSGTVLARYTTGSPSLYSPLLHMWRSSGASRFPLYDLTGTARGLTDASGTVTDTYTTDTFGRQISSTGSTQNPYRYGGASGYIRDPSGLQQLGARFYWPELGRFIQREPLGGGGGSYVYAADNPVRLVDANGLQETTSMWLNLLQSESLDQLGMSAAATASGVFTGLTGGLWRPDWRNPCDPWGGFSRNMGIGSGVALGLAAGGIKATGEKPFTPFWRYVSPGENAALEAGGVPGRWMVRGGSPPYSLGEARGALGLGYEPVNVVPVRVPWWQPVAGPRPVASGGPGALEWYRGWRFPY